MTRLRQATPLFVLCSLLGLSLGCFEDVPPGTTTGSEDTSGDGDGDGDPTGDGDGDGDPSGDGDGDPTDGESCEGGFACVPDPGPAWMGPFALQDAQTGCGDAFPDEAQALFRDLVSEPAECSCMCGQPEVTCPNTMSVIGYASNNCVNGQGAQDVGENQCYNTLSASHGVSLGPAPSSCGPGTVSTNLPEPSFAISVLACGGYEPGPDTCETGAVCVPDPGPDALGGLCVTTAGDVACPAGYPNKLVYVSGFEDTRACPDSCSCSSTQAVCEVSVTGYADPNCVNPQGALSTESGAEVCAAASPVVESIKPGNVTVKDAGACNPGNVESTGMVESTGPTTVCCSE